MKNEKTPSKPRTTVRKAVAKAMDKTDKEITAKTSKVSADIQEQIRLKAYELYVARGCTHGDHMQDWLAAEQLVLKNSR